MIRRLFWLSLGVTIGALAVRKLNRIAERMRPSSLAASVAAGVEDIAESVGDFATDVRAAMQQREAVLRTGAGLDGELGRQEPR
jgi:chromosome condensin MukBEF MukE localization factor